VPPQFNFPQDIEIFKQYMSEQKKATYIAKPVASAQGDGIILFKQLNEVPQKMLGDVVVQRYIDDPLLLDGLKFDLRVYVVVTSLYPVIGFLCSEGLARFCTEPY